MTHAVKLFVFICRLSFSKNGVVRIDGFSSPDQYDDEALSLWTHENYEDDELDLETCKYILDIIGDKFCQLVTSEKTAMSWVKKDGKELSDSVFSVFRSFIEVLVLAMTCCLLLSTCFVWGYVGKGQEPSSAGCGAAGSSPQGRRPPSASTLPAQLFWDEMYPAGSKVKTQLSFLGS